jgi:hypothetical protein
MIDGEDREPAAPDPSFFDGRLLVEIEAWNCALSVGLSSALMPRQYTFQSGLDVTRGFDIEGRLRAPSRYRDQRISIHLQPFGPGREEWDEVGRLYFHPDRPGGRPQLMATLLVPEVTLSMIATCLGTSWKYIHVWTFDEDAEEASVSSFSFDTKVHKNLAAWVEA